ncbi:BioY family transporter [Clostridia bacterium]|nr:BioY family transporter [Clostridia bacterium]
MKRHHEFFLYLLCAFFAALTAVCSQIMVPLPFTPVPINLALLSVFICGTVLGPKKSAVSMLIYIALGAIGVPVFAGFTGGLGILVGPTGGYIVGYLASAVVMGLLASGKVSTFKSKMMQKLPEASTKNGVRTAASIGLTLLTGVPAIAACYALGTAWFMISTGTGFAASMMLCVIPFIPGDAVKIIFAAAVCEGLRRPMRALDILPSK